MASTSVSYASDERPEKPTTTSRASSWNLSRASGAVEARSSEGADRPADHLGEKISGTTTVGTMGGDVSRDAAKINGSW